MNTTLSLALRSPSIQYMMYKNKKVNFVDVRGHVNKIMAAETTHHINQSVVGSFISDIGL
jgi:hypothetical protein